MGDWRRLDALFEELSVKPVLMELGPRIRPFSLWRPLARHAIYIGAGPEATDPGFRDEAAGFFRTHVLPDVIAPAAGPVSFFITADPLNSSLLEPLPGLDAQYVDLGCSLVRVVQTCATTIPAVLKEFSLPSADWLHMNVNGVEVALYRGAPPACPLSHTCGGCLA